jgi:molecular chaperone Hsp33
MMPGADESIISSIEAAVSRMPHATLMIRKGATPHDLLKAALGEIEFDIMGEKSVSFECHCSYERAASMIASIDRAELESMLREDRGAVMTCHFCNETYRLDEADLMRLMEEG